MIKSHTGCYAWVAFLVGSGRKLRPVVVHTDSRFRYAALLRYCTDYAFGFSMLDETGFYAPSVAHNAFPSRPWLGISAYLNIILQYLNSFAMRSHENPCAPARRGLRPLRCGGNPPRRASLVILLGVNSNCPNSGECIALQQGLKNKQMFAIINEARK